MPVYFDWVMPFWLSIGSLSVFQGAMVALPDKRSPGQLARLQSPLWALIPAFSVIAFVMVGQVDEQADARALTYIALVGVPLLAAFTLGWLMRGARPWLVLAVVPLFALAWIDRGGVVGDGAAVALSVLACVGLGVLIAAVTPTRWLALGIVGMALADAILVTSDLLQQPNNALNAAQPVSGLPRLQVALFGSAVMGFGDLFVAGVLGGLLAITGSRRRQLGGAGLVVLLAVAFDLLFFAVNELPATVPVACGLILLVWVDRRRRRAWAEVRSERGPASWARQSVSRIREPDLN